MKYEKKISLKPKWRDILDSTKYPLWVGIVHQFVPIAKSMGYEMFIWNGCVVEITGDTCAFTGWTVNDLE